MLIFVGFLIAAVVKVPFLKSFMSPRVIRIFVFTRCRTTALGKICQNTN